MKTADLVYCTIAENDLSFRLTMMVESLNGENSQNYEGDCRPSSRAQETV